MEVDEGYDSLDQVGNDSLTGMVESMLEATRPHTPPRREDEEDAELLPPSPSPAKPHPQSSPEQPLEGSSFNSPRESTFFPLAIVVSRLSALAPSIVLNPYLRCSSGPILTASNQGRRRSL